MDWKKKHKQTTFVVWEEYFSFRTFSARFIVISCFRAKNEMASEREKLGLGRGRQ